MVTGLVHLAASRATVQQNHKHRMVLYTILVCSVLPVLIMTTSWTLLFRTAMKRSGLDVRYNRNLQPSCTSQLKTITTLLIVTGLFVAAWCSFFVYIILTSYLPEHLPSSIRRQDTLCGAFLNGCTTGTVRLACSSTQSATGSSGPPWRQSSTPAWSANALRRFTNNSKRSNLRHTRDEMSFSQSFYPQSSSRDS